MLWALLAMLVILAVAATIVLVVAYPHRDELTARLWLDGRRG